MNKKVKKALISIISITAAIVIILTVFGPALVLKGARQPEVASEYAYSEYFCDNYKDIRDNIKARVDKLTKNGVTVEANEFAIDAEDNLYIDNIFLPATESKDNLIVITTGVHGIEGYIGAAMLDVFFEVDPYNN